MKLFLLGVAVLIIGCVLFVLFAPPPNDNERPPLGIIMRNGHTSEELKNIYSTRDEQRQQIQATGIYDQGVDLTARQSWAAEHHLQPPTE